MRYHQGLNSKREKRVRILGRLALRDRIVASAQRATLACRPLRLPVAALACLMLVACASGSSPGNSKNAAKTAKESPPSGYLIADDAFKKLNPAAGAFAQGNPETSAGSSFVATLSSTQATFVPRVLLYSSDTTRHYLQAGGFDADLSRAAWENVLVKYKIPYKIATRADEIDRAEPALLILPSTIALSNGERQAIVDFRARGASVLVTWACGARSETGAWLGFGFMERALDTQVVGTTAQENDDNFLMPRGEAPITHSLPAGHRIWTERVPGWFPLRFAAKSPAVHIMDWSRNFREGRMTTVGHYDERTYANGVRSRIVALGLPERLWQTSDPRLIEALLYDSLLWLMRLPSASVAAWPSAAQSALLFAFDNIEVMLDADVAFGAYLEDAGVRATIYTIGDLAKQSAPRLQTLLGRGHELALEADKFAPFAGQPKDVQAKRIDSALAKIREAGLDLPVHPSFHAPLESYDKTTEALIRQRGFGHYIAMQDSSEALLPVASPPDAEAPVGSPSVVVFPRAQRGPEDAAEEGDVEAALKSFYAEFAATVQMRGVMVVRQPNQGILPMENLREVADELKRYRGTLWSGTASQIAHWWRDRERVSAFVEGTNARPVLTVRIADGAPLQHAVTTIVFPPYAEALVELLPDGQSDGQREPSARTFRLDEHRVAVEFSNLAPGTHRWQLRFRAPPQTGS